MENKKEEIINDQEGEVYYGVGSFLWEIAKVFFWALVIIVPIRIFLFQPFFVQGASMDKNFADGDYLIVNELGYKQTDVNPFGVAHLFTVSTFRDLSRGDVVVFRYPLDTTQFFIKRVIGLPGETVKIAGGKVTIINAQHPDGFVLDESKYLPSSVITSGSLTYTLNDQQYFVMGDNREFSHDSRAFGPVPKDDVIGKVLVRAWPFSKAAIF